MRFALLGYSRDERGVGIEGNAMGTKKKRIQDVYISEKCIIHQRLRIRRLDGERDGRATARIYRIAPSLEWLSETELGDKQHACTLDVDKRETIFGRLW